MKLRLAAVLCLLAVVLGACSSSGGGIRVDMAEFSVDPSVDHAAAGAVDFDVQNQGSVLHEFIVLKTKLSKLPVRDGLVETDSKGIEVVKSVLNVKPGQLRNVKVTLSQGKYQLICNVVGHYQSGMHSAFSVT